MQLSPVPLSTSYSYKRLPARLLEGLHASLIRRPGSDSSVARPSVLRVSCAARFSHNREIQSSAPNNNGTEWRLLGACSATAARTEPRSVGGVGSCDGTARRRPQRPPLPRGGCPTPVGTQPPVWAWGGGKSRGGRARAGAPVGCRARRGGGGPPAGRPSAAAVAAHTVGIRGGAGRSARLPPWGPPHESSSAVVTQMKDRWGDAPRDGKESWSCHPTRGMLFMAFVFRRKTSEAGGGPVDAVVGAEHPTVHGVLPVGGRPTVLHVDFLHRLLRGGVRC